MEGCIGLVGRTIDDSLPKRGHLSTTDRAQVRESPMAKYKHPNHWAMQPTVHYTFLWNKL